MKIEGGARTLLGAAAVGLLMMAGCDSAITSSDSSGSTGTPPASGQARVDWGMSLKAGGLVGLGQFPAKFTFDVTAAPDCTNDFVAFNTSLAGASGTTANIMAFNNLYSTQGGAGGLCGASGPSVMWSYFTGTGTAGTSVVISGDGTKVAFVEVSSGGAAMLRILKWKSGEGTGAAAPHAVDQDISGAAWSTCLAANSCVASIPFNGGPNDTRSAPFYEYNTDSIYVGDNGGRMHKFTDVFGVKNNGNNIPLEVTTTWPITVNSAVGAVLTSPVYDGVSGNIFVGDGTGRLSFIREVGSTVGTCTPQPCLDTSNQPVGTGGSIVDAPIVDGTNHTVIAVNGTDASTNHGTILQASTALASPAPFRIGGAATGSTGVYSGAFDNTYFSTPASGHMYVCGKDIGSTDRPAVYQLSFNSSGVLTGVGTPLTGLSNANAVACSPVTEFDNPNGGGTNVERDWVFFSVGGHSTTCGGNTGCVISINVTGGPTWPPAAVTASATLAANNPGSTSGIVVDNTSTSMQASSFYFSLGTNSSGTGPGLPSCNTTAGVGCAVKLTQSALN